MKLQHLALLWVVLVFPCGGRGQTSADIASLEFDDRQDAPRPAHPRQRTAHQRALKQQAYALRIGEVKVEGRWAGQVSPPLATGEVLTPEKLFTAMEALEAVVTADTLHGYGLRSQGEVGVLYIDVDFTTNAPAAKRTVDVTFRPYYIHFSLLKIGDNVLPIPRSPWPTFYENVPRPLLALRPVLGISYDRAFGTALGGALETDLLNLSAPARRSEAAEENRHLDFSAQGSQSLADPFHRADAGLRYHVRQEGETLQEFNFRAGYNGASEPLGGFDHTHQAGLGSAGLTLKVAANTRLSLDTGCRYTADRWDNPALTTPRTSAHEQFNRLLLDAIPGSICGFIRAAIWEDNGWQNDRRGFYQRVAGRIGYAREIPLTPSQTIGLELVAGGGSVWGQVPAHARFFGGNSPGQFLYDNPSSPSLMNSPSGPIIRSFGEGQAGLLTSGGARGGDAFWHVNLNLTFPIRTWSRALIPDELTDLEDADGNPTSIKQLLRRQIDVTGPSMLAATLRKEGLSQAAANARAKQILDELKPATHYLIDDASLWSLKPLLMFDAAGLSGSGAASQTWLAGGGGLQLTLVTAKFEAGYMHTFSGPTFGHRGNFFFRLVFQNLF